jgi:hypothetical protein
LAQGRRAMPAIASNESAGADAAGTAAAFRKSARHVSSEDVANAVIRFPRVFSLASVDVWELLSGSSSTLPQVPVDGSTRFGTLPAAIRRPTSLPLIAVPLMNRALVKTDATVVSSLTTAPDGAFSPRTDSKATAFPGPDLVVRYSTLPGWPLGNVSLNAPRSSADVSASTEGAALPAVRQSVTFAPDTPVRRAARRRQARLRSRTKGTIAHKREQHRGRQTHSGHFEPPRLRSVQHFYARRRIEQVSSTASRRAMKIASPACTC